MLYNWFSPISHQFLQQFQNLPGHKMVKNIELYENELPSLANCDICLIGVGKNTDTIRRYFYQLNQNFNNLSIADLGNLNPGGLDMIIPVLQEMSQSNILPIIICDSIDILRLQRLIAAEQSKVALVHRGDQLNPALTQNCSIAYIGHQSQLLQDNIATYQKENPHLNYRLGKIKANIHKIEPVIRDAKLACFDISAINAQFAPSQNNPWPTGLDSLEACQIARYIGITDSIESFSVTGYDASNDQMHLGAKTIAQILWFFIEGVDNRKYDFSGQTQIQQYTVNVHDFEFPIEFIKSEKSDRWWFKIPGKESGQDVFPCSYEDYELACNNDLSDRIVKAMSTI